MRIAYFFGITHIFPPPISAIIGLKKIFQVLISPHVDSPNELDIQSAEDFS